jgi:diguanylate cyclase (GGDEF)-like protein
MGRFAGMVGYGLDITVQKDLERRLEELATVDELTGACNRRYLQIHGPIELQRARRFRRPLAAMMIDLDHFKRVNDRFGHQFGDLVLSMLCELCRKALRPSDIFVRYGGEEFVVLMPETELSEALTAARRLANRIRTTVFSADPAIQGLTVSIGVCALEPADGDIGALVNRADGAMYRAKQLGRDRVESCPKAAA